MTEHELWQLYEQRKAVIKTLELSPDDYQKAIKALVDELGI